MKSLGKNMQKNSDKEAKEDIMKTRQTKKQPKIK